MNNVSVFDMLVARGKYIWRCHSNEILTVAECAAVAGLSVFLVKDTIKASAIINEEPEEEKNLKGKIKKAGKVTPYYKGSALCLAATGIVIAARYMTTKSIGNGAALAAIASVGNLGMYRKSVSEVCDKDTADKVNKKYLEKQFHGLEKEKSGKKLYYDSMGEQYIYLYPEDIPRAEIFINRYLNYHGECTLNDVYGFLGFKGVPEGDLVGWSMDYFYETSFDGDYWVDLDVVEEKGEDGNTYSTIVPSEYPTAESLYYPYLQYSSNEPKEFFYGLEDRFKDDDETLERAIEKLREEGFKGND